MNEHVTKAKTFYNFLFEQKEVAATVTSKFFLIVFPEQPFIRNNYTMKLYNYNYNMHYY